MGIFCTVPGCTIAVVNHEHVATTVEPTHEITFYGGKRELVRVLDDNTHTNYGFRYGTMRVIGQNGVERFVHFGKTNAVAISKADGNMTYIRPDHDLHHNRWQEIWQVCDEFGLPQNYRIVIESPTRIWVDLPTRQLVITSIEALGNIVLSKGHIR